jgi:GNAT superfamily N-acetyltransferase
MSDDTQPRYARTDQEIENCFTVIAELRPHLVAQEFVSLVREMETAGFRLAYIEDHGEVVCAAGYRVSTNLALGKNLYVDDLVTAQTHRSMGFGVQMLAWLCTEARRQGCKVLHLDSGVQRNRAHKFYLCQDLQITSYHFARELE